MRLHSIIAAKSHLEINARNRQHEGSNKIPRFALVLSLLAGGCEYLTPPARDASHDYYYTGSFADARPRLEDPNETNAAPKLFRLLLPILNIASRIH